MNRNNGLAWVVASTIFALLNAAEATVVVYKGSGTRTSGDGILATRTVCQIYFVFDFDTLAGNLIIAETKNKIVFDNGNRNYGIAELNTLPKDTVYLTSGDSSFNGPRNFAMRHVRFQGTKSLIQLLPGGVQPGNLPKSLSCFHSDTFGSPFAFVAGYQLTYDQDRTQSANIAGKNTAAVSADIRTNFVARLHFTDTTGQ
ncbi:MAG: hypothetical protein JWL90_387 [Chthoniobacteraceae bacterium]|nr:hypothetical protein [Chthoniobacteraceae bacterium]